MITGRRCAMQRIRAGRAKPGLQRQHLACVRRGGAAVRRARSRGAEVGSQALEFAPRRRCGSRRDLHDRHRHRGLDDARGADRPRARVARDARRALRAVIIGGTHNPMAPPFEFLERVFLPQLRAMGADVALTLERHGFMPDGRRRDRRRVGAGRSCGRSSSSTAGRRSSRVARPRSSRPADARRRARARGRARAARQSRVCRGASSRRTRPAQRVDARGRARERRARAVTGYGEKGLRAELVAERALRRARRLPRARRAGRRAPRGSAAAADGRRAAAAVPRVAPLSLHATTNIETIRTSSTSRFTSKSTARRPT